MILIKGFTGERWWKHKNPRYREACFRKASQELIEMKIGYDYLMKHNEKKNRLE